MSSSKKILILQGGWDGHHPAACADLFAGLLREKGHEVTVSDTMETLTDAAAMDGLDLFVPIWSMGEISDDQWKAISTAAQAGCGVAGFHGGMVDAFRMNCDYQWMTGAQWVAHPGNAELTYDVAVTDSSHPITRGLPESFTLGPTEQYYCHHDPGNHVLCTTVFDQAAGDPSLYHQNVVMPYAWTKTWGKGRVFCAAWGHSPADFDDATAREIVVRGMVWASR